MLWLFQIVSLLPLAVLHALGGVLGWAVWFVSAAYRQRFRTNSAQAGLAFDTVRPAIAEAGRFVAELPQLWLRPFHASCMGNVQMQGLETAHEAFSKGKGVIFFGPHCGSFELGPQALAEVLGPQRGVITAIYRPARQAWLAAIELKTRQRPHLAVLPASLSAIKAMHRALKAGRCVAMLTDQVPPDGQGIWAPFFGKPAYTMTLAARLALQTGAALLPVSCERLPGGRGYIVKIRPAVDLPPESELPDTVSATVISTVTSINQAIEAIVLSQPGQYLWGYGRYKIPRQDQSLGTIINKDAA